MNGSVYRRDGHVLNMSMCITLECRKRPNTTVAGDDSRNTNQCTGERVGLSFMQRQTQQSREADKDGKKSVKMCFCHVCFYKVTLLH